MIISLGMLMACGSGRPASTNPGTATATEGNRADMRSSDVEDAQGARNNKIDKRDSRNQAVNRSSVNSEYNFDSPEARKQRSGMYSSLNMTEDQINRYETLYRDNYESWRTNTQRKSMNSEDLRKHQNTALKSVLDDNQYKQYQQWSNDAANPRY